MHRISVAGVVCVTVLCVAFVAWGAEQEDWIAKGLVAHYKFEENTNDSSKNQNHATKITGTVKYVTGTIGKALYLDGKSCIEGDAKSFPMESSERTLCLWAKSEDANGEFDGNKTPNVPFGWGTRETVSSTGCCYGILEDGGPWMESRNWFTFTVDDRSLTYDVDFKTAVGKEWQFLCSVYKAGQIINYVNGAEVSKRKVDIKTTGESFNIGVFPGGRKIFKFKGSLDEIRIYNRALKQAEIERLYKLPGGAEKP